MGDILTFPLGGGANTLHVHRFTGTNGTRIEILMLEHRRGERVVWQTGDDGTIDAAIGTWRACGARLAEYDPCRPIYTQSVTPYAPPPPIYTKSVNLADFNGGAA